MTTFSLGTIIIFSVTALIAVVAIGISSYTLKEVSNGYEELLGRRREENRRLLGKLSEASERIAKLEAELTLTRVNKPQEEFFEVPKVKK